jgi:hypothetical protein
MLLEESLLRENKLKKQLENKLNDDNNLISEKLDKCSEIINNFKKEIENKNIKIDDMNNIINKNTDNNMELNKILKGTSNTKFLLISYLIPCCYLYFY